MVKRDWSRDEHSRSKCLDLPLHQHEQCKCQYSVNTTWALSDLSIWDEDEALLSRPSSGRSDQDCNLPRTTWKTIGLQVHSDKGQSFEDVVFGRGENSQPHIKHDTGGANVCRIVFRWTIKSAVKRSEKAEKTLLTLHSYWIGNWWRWLMSSFERTRDGEDILCCQI